MLRCCLETVFAAEVTLCEAGANPSSRVKRRGTRPSGCPTSDLAEGGYTGSTGASSWCIQMCPQARQRQYVTMVVRRVASTSSEAHATQVWQVVALGDTGVKLSRSARISIGDHMHWRQ